MYYTCETDTMDYNDGTSKEVDKINCETCHRTYWVPEDQLPTFCTFCGVRFIKVKIS